MKNLKNLKNAERNRLTVPVVPMALTNLLGSFFSRADKGTAMVKPFRRGMWSRVGLNVGAALAPAAVQPEVLQGRVGELMRR